MKNQKYFYDPSKILEKRRIFFSAEAPHHHDPEAGSESLDTTAREQELKMQLEMQQNLEKNKDNIVPILVLANEEYREDIARLQGLKNNSIITEENYQEEKTTLYQSYTSRYEKIIDKIIAEKDSDDSVATIQDLKDSGFINTVQTQAIVVQARRGGFSAESRLAQDTQSLSVEANAEDLTLKGKASMVDQMKEFIASGEYKKEQKNTLVKAGVDVGMKDGEIAYGANLILGACADIADKYQGAVDLRIDQEFSSRGQELSQVLVTLGARQIDNWTFRVTGEFSQHLREMQSTDSFEAIGQTGFGAQIDKKVLENRGALKALLLNAKALRYSVDSKDLGTVDTYESIDNGVYTAGETRAAFRGGDYSEYGAGVEARIGESTTLKASFEQYAKDYDEMLKHEAESETGIKGTFAASTEWQGIDLSARADTEGNVSGRVSHRFDNGITAFAEASQYDNGGDDVTKFMTGASYELGKTGSDIARLHFGEKIDPALTKNIDAYKGSWLNPVDGMGQGRLMMGEEITDKYETSRVDLNNLDEGVEIKNEKMLISGLPNLTDNITLSHASSVQAFDIQSNAVSIDLKKLDAPATIFAGIKQSDGNFTVISIITQKGGDGGINIMKQDHITNVLPEYVDDIQDNPGLIETKEKPLSPTSLEASVEGPNKAVLSWAKVDGAYEYVVFKRVVNDSERAVQAGGFEQIATTKDNSYVDTGVDLDKNSYEYQIVAKNPKGESEPSQTVSVDKLNNGPEVVKPIENVSIKGQEAFLVSLDGVFQDPEGQEITYIVENLPSWASFNSDTLTIEGTAPSALTANYEVLVKASDGKETAQTSFTIEIEDERIPEVKTVIQSKISEGIEQGSIIGTFEAIRLTDVQAVSNPEGAIGINALGQFVVLDSAKIDHESASNITISITAKNEDGSYYEKLISVAVENVEEAPSKPELTLVSPTISENTENGTEIGTLSAIDPEGQTLSYSIISSSAEGAFVIEGDKIKVLDNSKINFENLSNGVVSVVVEVSDGQFTSQETFQIEIEDIDEKPEILRDIPAQSVKENEPLSIDLNGVFADPESGEMAYSFENLPDWLTLNTNTMMLEGTPLSGQKGKYEITFKATDTGSNEVSIVFNVEVIDNTAPEAPTLANYPTLTNQNVISLDVQGEVGSEIVIEGVSYGSIPEGGVATISIDISGLDDGSYEFGVGLKDLQGNEGEVSTFTIEKDTLAPEFVGFITEKPSQRNTSYDLKIEFSEDLDAASVKAFFENAELPGVSKISFEGKQISFTWNTPNETHANLVFDVTDKAGNSSQKTEIVSLAEVVEEIEFGEEITITNLNPEKIGDGLYRITVETTERLSEKTIIAVTNYEGEN
ncbi:MAG: putative Ig domain-containing protein, partial [Candidatus Gracilibacteria bacterium]|nr:putative Ig domain-containing protein [Candidatus Gracilibacteria bacterium]